jgi:hypothetical protein
MANAIIRAPTKLRTLTSTWKLDRASGAATSAVAKQSAGAPASSVTKRAPTPSGQPSWPTTESVPDGASSATSATDGRARATDTGAPAAAAAATTRTPRLAPETARRDCGGFLEKRVAGEGSGEERREGEDDAGDMTEIGG